MGLGAGAPGVVVGVQAWSGASRVGTIQWNGAVLVDSNPRNLVRLDSIGTSAEALGSLHDQGVSWLFLLPDGYEGDRCAELATSSITQ